LASLGLDAKKGSRGTIARNIAQAKSHVGCSHGEPMQLYRHGDVIVASVDELPKEAEKREGVTLAYGESTGHSHRIADPTTAETFLYEGLLYLRVIAPVAELIHEEHKTITLPQGIYRVWQQREYTPQAIRTVYD
ncbi:MAG: hypothetical protein AAF787_12245, partial [Chloroflexota bacterium]